MHEKKNAPAKKGARFDSGGFCLAHSDIRLCKLTAEGKYKTVRKICFKCGNAGLMTNVQKTKLHGYRKKSKSHQGVSSEMLSSGNNNHTTGHRRRKKGCNSQDPPARAERRKSIDPPVHPTTHRSSSHTRRDVIRMRGRTLSPLRKSLPNKIPKIPSSSSEVVKQKVTKQKISELMQLMPPSVYKPLSKSGSSRRANQSSGVRSQNANRKSMRQPVKKEMPFDGNGHCRAHPEVRLAEKDIKGEWNIVSGVCPQCCVSAVMACQQEQTSTSITDNPSLVKTSISKGPNRDCKGLIGKLIGKEVLAKSDDSHTQATSPSSSYLATPDPATPESIPKPAFSTDYFISANQHIIGMALDIERGERIVEELTELKLGVSESTIKHTNTESVRRSMKTREPPGRRL